MKQHSLSRFLIPSAIGIFLFLIPIPYQGEKLVPIAVIGNCCLTYIGVYMPYIVALLFSFSTLLGLLMKYPRAAQKMPFLAPFAVSWEALFLRLIAAIWASMAVMHQGPELLVTTGNYLLTSILPILAVNLLIANILLPLLLDFGFFEAIGILLAPVMRPLFNLPGVAAVNCMLAWVGDSAIGSLVALDKYEKKVYTERETSIVITCFSATSVTLCIGILASLHLKTYFLHFYATTILSSIIAAMIMSRIPPLVRKSHIPTQNPNTSTLQNFSQRCKIALAAGKERAHNASFSALFHYKNALKMVHVIISFFPSIMLVGSLSLLVANHTSFFFWLGKPFIPLLQLIGAPDPEKVASVLFVGFADMLIPSVLIEGATNPMTRFIVACLSVTQIVYLSELGALLFGSKLPISFLDMLIIFILRTLITLPLILLAARYIFLPVT